MKILFINVHYYPITPGGAEISIKLLAEQMVKDGHKVGVYCIDRDCINKDNELNLEIINGVEVYRMNGGQFKTKDRHVGSSDKITCIVNKIIEVRNYSIKNDLEKIIDEFKPDVIYTNNLMGISTLVWKIAKKKNIRIVHTLRDYWLLSISGEIEEKRVLIKCINAIYSSYIKYMSKYVDVVTAPSEFTINKFLDKGYFKKSKKIHINNAIKIDLTDTKKIIDKKIAKNEQIIKFLYIGKLDKIKGLDILLETISEINNSKIELTICGDGKLENMVRDYCKKDKRIKFKGYLNSKDVKTIMEEHDVIIVPSVWNEPFGRVIIEGFQNGMVCIGSNRGGIPDIIRTMKCGRIIDIEKENDLKEAISYYSSRDNIKRELPFIKNNILKYSVEKQADEFVKCMRK